MNKVVHVPLPSAIAFCLVGNHLVLTIGMGETAYSHSSFTTKTIVFIELGITINIEKGTYQK